MTTYFLAKATKCWRRNTLATNQEGIQTFQNPVGGWGWGSARSQRRAKATRDCNPGPGPQGHICYQQGSFITEGIGLMCIFEHMLSDNNLPDTRNQRLIRYRLLLRWASMPGDGAGGGWADEASSHGSNYKAGR